MKYIMRAGTLYFNDIVSARIKGAFIGSGKKIYSANDSILMYTDIANLEVPLNEAMILSLKRQIFPRRIARGFFDISRYELLSAYKTAARKRQLITKKLSFLLSYSDYNFSKTKVRNL